MLGWGAFLAVAIGPLVKRALLALGIGIFVYTGFSALKGEVASAVATMWGGLAADTYGVLALAGFVDALGVWLGALSVVVAVATVKRLGVLAS